MLIARTKSEFPLLPWIPITGGIILIVLLAAKANYREMQADWPVWVLGVLLIVLFLFVLPIRSMNTWQEIHIDRDKLRVVKQPSKAETAYYLGELYSWQLKETFGRYDSGTWHLYLSFLSNGVTKKVTISENILDGFEVLIKHFKKYHRAQEIY